jgi:hypothetical protein
MMFHIDTEALHIRVHIDIMALVIHIIRGIDESFTHPAPRHQWNECLR